MAIFKPFKAFRPQPSLAQAVASKPYDVLDSSEAKDEAEGNPHSFLRVIKPEIELSEETDPYSDEVYEKGRENFLKLCKEGVFEQDSTACKVADMICKRLREPFCRSCRDKPRHCRR